MEQPTATYDDAELVKKLKRNNRKAQFEIYTKYVKMVFHTVYRMLTDWMEAEDVTQECFVKVFSKIGQYKGESSIGWWIKRIAINLTLNRIHQNRMMRFDSLDGIHLTEKVLDEPPPLLKMDQIQKSILALPEGCRVIFNLYLLEGYSHIEIAQILGISESTSKTQYRRARLLLQTSLKKLITYE